MTKQKSAPMLTGTVVEVPGATQGNIREEDVLAQLAPFMGVLYTATLGPCKVVSIKSNPPSMTVYVKYTMTKISEG